MKTVIEMAREAEDKVIANPDLDWKREFAELVFESFAELVRAEEREACAKLADEYATWGGSNFHDWFKKLSADIRARGNT